MYMSEGDLNFSFPADWQVSKYDDWSYYRNQFNGCCSGCKAVDFIAITSGKPKELLLIEVKDFNVHPRIKALELPAEIAQKVRDSLAGIVAASFKANDKDEKSFARKSLQAGKVRVVLHLEQPKKHSRLFPRAIDNSKVFQKLKALLRAIDPHPLVVERRNCQSRAGWTVQAKSK